MFDPISTYRIQFNKDFTFKDFSPVIPYLHQLGIKTIYASPIYTSVPGSVHGYDVVNPNQINPEIGTLQELRQISQHLKALDMCWLQDLVPNHMGFHLQNTWLMDVLKNGEGSIYRNYFDLTMADLQEEPLMVPFLGNDLQTVIANGELELVAQNGAHFFKYFDDYWPLRADLGGGQLSIAEVAEKQHYRLCSHQETNTRINYRRFFTVNSLICLNIDREEVFHDYHQLTLSLLNEGVFQGLRIDHVDGLSDPAGYLARLRKCCGQDTYIVVEKILEPGEQLPRSWPVQGTTGYDYLGLTNQLFTNQKAESKFDAFYKDMGSFKQPVYEQILRKKRGFLDQYMQGELDNLCKLASDLKLFDLPVGGNQEKAAATPVFRQLIADLLVRLPVYRFYSTSYPLAEEEVNTLESIFDDLHREGTYNSVLPVFSNVLLGKDAGESKEDPAIIFYKRFMQFSGPLMAKGVEDTLMYTFNRFIGNNEVGDSPELFGMTAIEFHQQIILRTKYWPLAINATATHDTKRGEDARARLAVLTDLKSEWVEEVRNWQELNQEMRIANSPDANDEYFIYQTLVATCPEGGPAEEDYPQRLMEYMEKALRESKRNSEWDEPDLDYESRTKDFIRYLLDPSGKFWPRFQTFFQKVSGLGKLTSLSSLVLKHTLPGIPDTYQGTEDWDLSMVDPDNRRAIDYKLRGKLLSRIRTGQAGPMANLFSDLNGEGVKMRLLQQLLRLRKELPDLFAKGAYLPLATKGKYAANVIAYARQYQAEWLIVSATISLSGFISGPVTGLQALDWEDTCIVLPNGLNGAYDLYRDELRGDDLKDDAVSTGMERVLQAADLLHQSPVAVRRISLQQRKRGGGVLMHVSSLPSAYGIGDFGPVAFQFLSFLQECGMKYWQVLPMNPLSAEQAYSPYSSPSVMAGNILFISPEELAESGLLTAADLENYKQQIKRKVSYVKVSELKNDLLSSAYQNWKLKDSAVPDFEFAQFCAQESEWLDDYALFVLISGLEQNRPWLEWPEGLKNRDSASLNDIRRQYTAQLEAICWQQFIFFRQWKVLKAAANRMGIKIIGDLPFYAAHNSADVWTHRKLFELDAEGSVRGIAGVPPDYFNADGQLWGMPVYHWKTMARNRYQWWTDRVEKNLEIYDMIRLDHFRAFSQYWEVPAGAEQATSGKWKPGPGKTFFKSLLKALGTLPVIAEDLGEINPEVYQLRDEFNFPGMKILQFAFGEDLSGSIHAPHNFENTNAVVYTGTHDNNTTQGWYQREADEHTRKRLEGYVGTKVTKRSVAGQLIRMALSSTADIAIIPMQDLLNKPAKGRMNTPASTDGNWVWRLKGDELNESIIRKLKVMMRMFGR